MNAIKRSLRSGFSLIEIMIALAIIVTVMGVITVNVFGLRDKSKIDTTKLDVRGFKQNIDLFYADTGSYPNDLNDLVEKPSDERIGAKWSGPYLTKLKDDEWNHVYLYERTPQGAHPYELYSFGPKGEDAPEEERISAWE